MKSFKEQTAGMTFWKKAAYTWMYYKALIIAIAAGIAILIYVFWWIAQDPVEEIFSLVLTDVDEQSMNDDTWHEDFITAYGYVSGEQEITVDSSLDLDIESADSETSTSYQILTAMVLTGETDLIICEADLAEMLQENNGLSDLWDYLEGTQLEQYLTGEAGSEACCMIEIPQDSFLYEQGWYTSDMTVYACLTSTGDCLEEAAQFIEFIFDYE